MADTRLHPALTTKRGGNPLCFLMDDDFVVRRDLAKALRLEGIDIVEFSNSARFMEMIDNQDPDVVFVNVNDGAPHECVRALLALKECGYSGAVQLFGGCTPKLLESFNTVGADCALTMLPPLQKPIKVATISRIVLDRKLGATDPSSVKVSLSDALAKNLVKFLYQPKFDLKTKAMVGAEAVARVAHPELGLLTPDRFLKGANEEAFLNLSRAAVVSAVRASAHFHQMGVALALAINIGVDSLLRLPVADLVLMHRPEANNWAGLVLEITERQVVNSIELLKARLPKLREAGVSIAVDNVGPRASLLGVLTEASFAEIKIDRSLVEGCAANAGNAKVCKSLIQTAHNFGCRAVAVGLSAEADLGTLAGFGCDVGQGYLFGKPMSVGQIDALVAHSKEPSQ
jgi:EAL domain-containing protein (putative c-di-GMP-specific phosphodiesterase class I)